MDLIAIRIQSCSDLITNSSSELFQLETSRTPEEVEEMLSSFTRGYYYPIRFNLAEYREWKKCPAKYDLPRIPYPKYAGTLEEQIAQWEKYIDEKSEAYKNCTKPVIFNTVSAWFFDKEDKSDVHSLRVHYLLDAFGWGKKYHSVLQTEFIRYVQKAMGIPYHKITAWEILDEIVTTFIEEHIDELSIDKIPLSWHYLGRVEDLEGCILLQSADENSIPYDDFETIRDMFNGVNYHLGWYSRFLT